jgi:hypothetical protein
MIRYISGLPLDLEPTSFLHIKGAIDALRPQISTYGHDRIVSTYN